MELCGDLIERVHKHLQEQNAVDNICDGQVSLIASETKSQVRSQSTMEKVSPSDDDDDNQPVILAKSNDLKVSPLEPAR